MPEPPTHPETTDDYRKYPKGPNFGGIVIGAAVVLLLIMIAAVVILRSRAKTMLPARQSSVSSQPLSIGTPLPLG